MADALGPSDYQMLFQMLTSPNDAQRQQAQTMAGKLTPDEAQQFFDFQHLAHGASPELHREDNSLLGMPPEAAVATGLGVGGAVLRAGLSGASKAAAAGKAALGMATPVVKYEATKTVLEHAGVPAPLAIVAAMAVAGYKGGSAEAPAAAEAASTAPTAAEGAATVPAPAPPVSPAAAPTAAQAAEEARWQELLTRLRGKPDVPVSAPPPVASPAPTPAPAPPPVRVLPPARTEAAMKAYIMKSGLSEEVADAMIAKLKAGKGNVDRLLPAPVSVDPAAELARRLGTKSDAEVAADMASRYQRGQKSLAKTK